MNPKNVISGRIIWWIVGGMIGVIVILWGFNRWAEYEIIRRLESDQSQISSGLVKVRAGAGKVVLHQEIGRASCRERASISVVAESVKKKRYKTHLGWQAAETTNKRVREERKL